jgi:hypothetical protein
MSEKIQCTLNSAATAHHHRQVQFAKVKRDQAQVIRKEKGKKCGLRVARRRASEREKHARAKSNVNKFYPIRINNKRVFERRTGLENHICVLDEVKNTV